MDGPWKQDAKPNDPVTKGHTLHDFLHETSRIGSKSTETEGGSVTVRNGGKRERGASV